MTTDLKAATVGALVSAYKGNFDPDELVELLGLPVPNPYTHWVDTHTSNIHHFEINAKIGNPAQYTDMINTIRAATDRDAVILHINSPGGRLDSTIQIINAIQHTEAIVYGVLEGQAASAASAILLCCDEIQVMPHTMMMIHNYSTSIGGTRQNIRDTFDAHDRLYRGAFREWYIPFLTEQEFDRIMDSSEDLYLTAEQVKERLDRCQLIREKEAKRIERAVKQAARAASKATTESEPPTTEE